MPSLMIRAEDLSEGDVLLLLPFGRTAKVEKIRDFGPRARFVQLRTQFGWTRLDRLDEGPRRGPKRLDHPPPGHPTGGRLFSLPHKEISRCSLL